MTDRKPDFYVVKRVRRAQWSRDQWWTLNERLEFVTNDARTLERITISCALATDWELAE